MSCFELELCCSQLELKLCSGRAGLNLSRSRSPLNWDELSVDLSLRLNWSELGLELLRLGWWECFLGKPFEGSLSCWTDVAPPPQKAWNQEPRQRGLHPNDIDTMIFSHLAGSPGRLGDSPTGLWSIHGILPLLTWPGNSHSSIMSFFFLRCNLLMTYRYS